MAKILIAEDDKNTANMVKDWLESHHFIVDTANTGQEALDYLDSFEYEVLILDWDLPLVSGPEILKNFRAKNKQTPVIMLTAQKEIDKKAICFEAGVDDYLTKPFDLKELVMRINAVRKRSSAGVSNVLEIKNLSLDTNARKLTKDGTEIRLAPREYELLEFLMKNPDQVFSTEAILNRVWPSDSDATATSIRSCMKKLRKKIDTDDSDSIIKNLHGVGYRLES